MFAVYYFALLDYTSKINSPDSFADKKTLVNREEKVNTKKV